MLVLSMTIREIQFIKNTYLNQLTVKIKKVCCFGSKEYSFMLENAYIFCEKTSEKVTKIVILNTLKNPRDIDLDKSNIKNIPLNLIYESHGLKGNYDEIKIKIDNFFGQQYYENNIYDEINKYIDLNNMHYEKDEKKLFDKYMKITDHFYTLFFYDANKNKRIDFIYSDDFERLFIGEVNGLIYKKTFLFNLNEIDYFRMSKTGTGNDDITHYYIQIYDKNHRKSEIHMGYYVNEKSLPKFILLLNGKLKDINEKNKQ